VSEQFAHSRNRRPISRRSPSSSRCLAVAAALIVATPASAVKPHVFANCQTVDAHYAHGIARDFKAVKKASGLTGRPFVSSKLYVANRSKNRDHEASPARRERALGARS
jgi:hypothetical protein